MTVLIAWKTWVWLSSHDKIWYPALTPISLYLKQNENEIHRVSKCRSQALGEKTTSATWRKQDHLKGRRSLSLNFNFLNKTFTVLNNRKKCIVYSGKMRLNYVLKLLQSAWSSLNVSSCTNCWYDFITRTVNVVLFV